MDGDAVAGLGGGLEPDAGLTAGVVLPFILGFERRPGTGLSQDLPAQGAPCLVRPASQHRATQPRSGPLWRSDAFNPTFPMAGWHPSLGLCQSDSDATTTRGEIATARPRARRRGAAPLPETRACCWPFWTQTPPTTERQTGRGEEGPLGAMRTSFRQDDGQVASKPLAAGRGSSGRPA